MILENVFSLSVDFFIKELCGKADYYKDYVLTDKELHEFILY